MSPVRPIARVLRSQSGFTLAELLVAVAVIGFGLVVVAGGFAYGIAGVEAGRQQTTATFLAEQRLEQVKGTAFAGITAANFPDESYGGVTGAPNYRRSATITNNPGAIANSVLVEVRVFYRPITAFGVSSTEREVRLSTFLVSR